MRPIRVDPVALTNGTFGSSSSALPTVSSGPMTRPTNAPNPSGSRTDAAMRVNAIAVSGVLRDGFQMFASPHTRDSIEFHDHTATGKLNAVMIPTVPSGCHVSRIECCGRSD